MRVDRAKDHVIAADKRGHPGAEGIPLRPVGPKAGKRRPVRLEFLEPAQQQGVRPRGAHTLEGYPHGIATVRTDQLHLQVVGVLEASRPRFLNGRNSCSQDGCGRANDSRDVAVCRGNAVVRIPRHAKLPQVGFRRIGARHTDGAEVLAIGAGQQRQHRPQILDMARHRPDLPQRFDPAAGRREVARTR